MSGSEPPLRYEVRVRGEPRPGAPRVVLLHGRGADRRDLLPIADGLPDGTTLITPEAPHPGAPWGYGPGWAWYRYRAEDRLDPETLEESLERLGAFLDALPELLPPSQNAASPDASSPDAPSPNASSPNTSSPLFLGGFSQGGTTALAWALRNPGRVAGAAVLSGFLASNADLPVQEGAPGLRVFWGHGVHDPAIPHALGERGRQALEAAGARLDAHDYPAGHGVTAEEIRDLSAWMEGGAG